MTDPTPSLPIDIGEDSLSDTLPAFAEPALETTTGGESFRSALTLAVLAWNISLLPESKQQTILETRLEPLMTLYQGRDHDTVRQIVEMLVQRRLQKYADQRRFILGFELDEATDPPMLSVTSSGGGVGNGR